MACRLRRRLGNPLATIWFCSRQAFRPEASRSSKRPPLFPTGIRKFPFSTKISQSCKTAGTIREWVECGGESWKSAHLWWSSWSKMKVGAADWNATNFCIKIAQGEGVAQWVEENESCFT
ncbi:Ribosomal RNA large subunit methyltransferase [Trichinella spiralis]|uniref:Ribosomal RNA large subunit methyltransferase n=1 Tax=Trichinella spiralis TaxID=6334 RepID=A0ABR3KPD2_TRISP